VKILVDLDNQPPVETKNPFYKAFVKAKAFVLQVVNSTILSNKACPKHCSITWIVPKRIRT